MVYNNICHQTIKMISTPKVRSFRGANLYEKSGIKI